MPKMKTNRTAYKKYRINAKGKPKGARACTSQARRDFIVHLKRCISARTSDASLADEISLCESRIGSH